MKVRRYRRLLTYSSRLGVVVGGGNDLVVSRFEKLILINSLPPPPLSLERKGKAELWLQPLFSISGWNSPIYDLTRP